MLSGKKKPVKYLLEGASRGNLVESCDLIFQTKPQGLHSTPQQSKVPAASPRPTLSLHLVRWATAALCSQQALREILHQMKIQCEKTVKNCTPTSEN